MLTLLSPIALMLMPVDPDLEEARMPNLLQSGGLSSTYEAASQSVTLQGPDILMRTLATCTYLAPDARPSELIVVINWGDGYVFANTTGVPGTSCADQTHHRYDHEGPYSVTVSIGTNGTNDQFVPLYEGATVVWH